MEHEEINVLFKSSRREKLYKGSFKVYNDSLFTSCDKNRAIHWIGNEIFKDMASWENIENYKIDSGKENLNNSFREFFREQKQKALKKQEELFYNWDDAVGGRLGLLACIGTGIAVYFNGAADCATDTATYLNDVSKNLAFLTGIIQTGIAFGIPLLAGGFSYISSSKTINFIGKKYRSLKNKYSSKAKNHGEKLKNDIELYGKLERAVVKYYQFSPS